MLATSGQAPDNLHARALFRALFDEDYICAVCTDPLVLQPVLPNLTAFCASQYVTASSEKNAFSNPPALVDIGGNRRVSVQSALVLPDIVYHSDFRSLIPYHLIPQQADISLSRCRSILPVLPMLWCGTNEPTAIRHINGCMICDTKLSAGWQTNKGRLKNWFQTAFVIWQACANHLRFNNLNALPNTSSELKLIPSAAIHGST
ncbi:hypothetical protein [Neisseria iguanae]|uniref:hypothetical protein n=1 Tax=Neisseria iguanae TaxID=90242 RepID=UPI0011B1FD92|nr:hypothetical protein [Neisseria iguanae]